jgi:hypothetical protein
MPKNEPAGNRHQLRVWLKLALETGLLEKLPPQYEPDDAQRPQPTDQYARQLLAELKDPDASKRPLREIVADTRRFRDWIDFRRKVNVRNILAEGTVATVPERLPSFQQLAEDYRRRRDQAAADAKSNPMWDDWLDV